MNTSLISPGLLSAQFTHRGGIRSFRSNTVQEYTSSMGRLDKYLMIMRLFYIAIIAPVEYRVSTI